MIISQSIHFSRKHMSLKGYLYEHKPQNIVSSLVLHTLLPPAWLPTSLGGPAGWLRWARNPHSCQLPHYILPPLLLLLGSVTPPTRYGAINSPEPLQPLKPSMPQAGTTSELQLAKVVATATRCSRCHPSPEVPPLKWSGRIPLLRALA